MIYVTYDDVSRMKHELRALYPNFKLINDYALSDAMNRIYPYKIELQEGMMSAYTNAMLPTRRQLALFRTYLFITKEFHELWDL
jgi:hypothetical protein